jgi:hypothetical protein
MLTILIILLSYPRTSVVNVTPILEHDAELIMFFFSILSIFKESRYDNKFFFEGVFKKILFIYSFPEVFSVGIMSERWTIT